MTTIAMKSLWEFLQSLSLSQRNRKWLAEKLLDAEKKDGTDPTCMSKEDFFARLDKAEQGQSHVMRDDENLSDFLKRRGYEIPMEPRNHEKTSSGLSHSGYRNHCHCNCSLRPL